MTARQKILLVEDSATQALQFSELLEGSGFDVRCAGSGEEALEMLAAETPDLLIVDYHLPGIRGDELCRRVRLSADMRAIPVLMVTASGGDDVEKLGLRSGVDDYMGKQEKFEVALLRIRALLRRSQISVSALTGDGQSSKPRLLVVDDSETWLTFMAETLSENGYEVTAAKTSEQGWEMFQESEFDGALLDLHLPDMPGTWLTNKIATAQANTDRQCVVMIMTGDESSSRSPQVLDAGADDVVHKSRDIEIIRARLEALLRRKFLYEENQRLLSEFRDHERRILRAESEREAAEAKAALSAALQKKNDELEAAYRELKEAQSQLVQKAKMASLGELVAGVAHEINNPLSFVMSHVATMKEIVELIADESGDHLSQKACKKLDKARQRCTETQEGLERIRQLVLNLRTFSRLDEGEVHEVNVHEALDATLTMLEHRMRNGIGVKRAYAGNPMIECQAGPLNQVWMNLLANAIDAMNESGQLILRTRDENGALVVEIEDTGQGMNDEVLQRIFEPFYTTKQQGEGTGLGLSISYGIVQSHSGTIAAESVPGSGTCFTLNLPRRFSPPQAAE